MDYLYEIISLVLTVLISTITIPITTKKLIGKFKSFFNYNKEFEKKIQRQEKAIAKIENDINQKNTDSLSIKHNNDNNCKSNTSTISFSQNEIVEENNILNYDYFSKKESLSEMQKKRQTDELLKIVSFILAVIMTIVGTIIIFVGVIASFVTKEFEWISIASGAIVDLIAFVYFWLVNRTMKEVKDNSKQLEKAEDIMTAIELAEKITDSETRNETYKNMIENLMINNR